MPADEPEEEHHHSGEEAVRRRFGNVDESVEREEGVIEIAHVGKIENTLAVDPAEVFGRTQKSGFAGVDPRFEPGQESERECRGTR